MALLMLLAVSALTPNGAGLSQTMNERAVVAIQAEDLKAPFDFIVIGDPQGRYEATARLISNAERLNPAFAIFVGDLTMQGRPEQYQQYLDCIGKAKMPVLSVIGNHDVDDPTGRTGYERIFGKPDFSFEAGGRRFVILDSSGDDLAPAQLTWLQGVLDARQRAYVFTHRPPYMGNWWFSCFSNGTTEFLGMVRRARVPWVFMGHLHMLDGLTRDGTRFLVVGSGGIIPKTLPTGKPARCFVRVRVSPETEEVEVYGLQGERLEVPKGVRE